MKVKCIKDVVHETGAVVARKGDIMRVGKVHNNLVNLFPYEHKDTGMKTVDIKTYDSNFITSYSKTDKIESNVFNKIEDMVGNEVCVGDRVGFIFNVNKKNELVVGEVIKINQFYNAVVEVFVRDEEQTKVYYLSLKDEQILLTK